jgi:dTDP-4-amino-4,6-dideoxygalactose transaminase
MPSSAQILPYLKEIDERCWYSNCGPLVTRLEEQLGRSLGLSDSGVVTTANATVGLTAALLARRVPAGSCCIMPSWTFAATPHAARAAGMIPWFHDVERRTWALHPEAVLEALKQITHPVGAVMVVSPFGAPIDIQAWQAFEDRTGVAVVVDAAAGFDTALARPIPFVVSLHATKIFGAGEGGFIATTDTQLRARVRACCNFGFNGSRSAELPALNAKMSEYHAAVALANFQCWPAIRQQHIRIMAWYRSALARLPGVSLQPGYGEGWATGTTSVVLPPRMLAGVVRHLLEHGIETRAWWGDGCHTQPAFSGCPQGALPVTTDLGSRVLGLPHFPDMCQQDVDQVVGVLAEALRSLAVKNRRAS